MAPWWQASAAAARPVLAGERGARRRRLAMERGVLAGQHEGHLKGVLVSQGEFVHRVGPQVEPQRPVEAVGVPLPADIGPPSCRRCASTLRQRRCNLEPEGRDYRSALVKQALPVHFPLKLPAFLAPCVRRQPGWGRLQAGARGGCRGASHLSIRIWPLSTAAQPGRSHQGAGRPSSSYISAWGACSQSQLWL